MIILLICYNDNFGKMNSFFISCFLLQKGFDVIVENVNLQNKKTHIVYDWQVTLKALYFIENILFF